MKSVHESLEKFLEERKIPLQLEAKFDDWLQNPAFLSWWQNHPEWSREELLRYISQIRQFVEEQQNCEVCKGLTGCKNMMRGHFSEIDQYGKMLDLAYTACYYQQQENLELGRKELIKSHHIPKEILTSSFSDFDHSDDGRLDAFNAVMEFCLKANPGKDPVGLYLYGPLGAGKSFLIGAACNKLASRGIGSYMVYSPDFFREMKSAIADQTVDEKLQALKEIPVLIFDDIGAESITAWARDEVLGTILQYRMMEKLPTLYTSNYNYDQLEDHLSYSSKGGIEQLKAKRIMERIRHYTDAYFVDGKNRRVRR